MLTAALLGRLWPHAPHPHVDGILAAAPAAFVKF